MGLYDWYVISELYTSEECNKILEICTSNNSRFLGDAPAPGKQVDTKIIELNNFENTLEKYFNVVNDINATYFGYNLYPEKPLGINFNSYGNELNEYPYHRDSTEPGTMADSKLTAILNISPESYVGGEFFMFLGKDFEVPLISKQGSLLVFPSFIYHKVCPVTLGFRYTLSTWLKGPNWR